MRTNKDDRITNALFYYLDMKKDNVVSDKEKDEYIDLLKQRLAQEVELNELRIDTIKIQASTINYLEKEIELLKVKKSRWKLFF